MRRFQFTWVLVGMLCMPASVGAADLTVTLPTVTTAPGSTVLIPIEVTPNPSAFGIYSIDFRIDLDPAVVQSSSSQPDGFLQFWGSPFVNATPSLVAAATGGLQPLTTATTRLNTLQLSIKPTAVLGTDMPLTFTTIRCNEGVPSVSVVSGVVRVRGSTAVESEPANRLSLSPASPDPVRSRTRFAFQLPAEGDAQLALYGIDGRRVRTLVTGRLAAGAHERQWDVRDDAGRSVAAGIYFARLEYRGRSVHRRVAVLP